MITVYVLSGEMGKSYVGITNNLDRRLSEHRSGRSKGAHVLGEFRLVLSKAYPDYASARAREVFHPGVVSLTRRPSRI